MGSFRLARVEELPDWLADDEVGRPYQEVLGAAQDAELRKLKDAVLATFPPTMPDDALAYAAADALLERAPDETADAFRLRLHTAVDDAAWWGTKKGMRDLFAPLGVDVANVYVFGDHETSFGHDGVDSPWWSRVWWIVDSGSGPWTYEHWDEALTCDSGLCWDSTMTVAELEYIRRRIRRQKSPGAYPAYLLLVLWPSSAWDTGLEWDDGVLCDQPGAIGADTSSDYLTGNPLGLVDGETVVFAALSGGVLPSPLAEDTVYYVRDALSNRFKVAATAGGSAVDLTDIGTPSYVVVREPPRQCVIPLVLWHLWDEGVEITGEGPIHCDAGHAWDELM